MKTTDSLAHGVYQTQQFHRQYSANSILPDIDWRKIFHYSRLENTHLQALNTLYQSIIPLALQVFDELNFDVFSPPAFDPQGLGLFDKLGQQEDKLLQTLEDASHFLDDETRHQIWSMLLRGAGVVVFKAWLGKVKSNSNQLDMTQIDELSDLLFIKTPPQELAQRLQVMRQADYAHIFLMHGDDIFLDRFNCLETAALFVDLGVYDAAFLSLRDERVADYLKAKNYVTQSQIDDLRCALNPLGCPDLVSDQNYLA